MLKRVPLISQRTQVGFPAPTWYLTPICNCSSRSLDALIWPLQALNAYGALISRQNTHIHKTNKQKDYSKHEAAIRKLCSKAGSWMDFSSFPTVLSLRKVVKQDKNGL